MKGLFGKGWLSAGYLFLYLPIVSLVVFSFNDSAIPNRWAGFTLNCTSSYSDNEMLSGLKLSLMIAFPARPARSCRHAGRVRARQVQALHRAHAVRHGQCAAGDARCGRRHLAAADAGLDPARVRPPGARHADDPASATC